MYMTGDEIRSTYLNFFEDRGHLRVPSSSLLPDDPTLMFTSAGMVQFKPYFLGQAEPPNKRLTTVQKCLRTGDLENVGHTSRHHTFFEMLGNFSVGDYFKKEAITWAWELITERFQLPPDRLWVTIYQDDDESFEIWHNVVGIPENRIVRMGKEDNFWGPPGPTGPCGPCSEIYYDMGEEWPCDDPSKGPAAEGERFREFWNLVFTQYYQDENGNMSDLPRKNIDTGMGLERMAAILQGKPTNFETDLFEPILRAIEDITGKKYEENLVPFRVVADHVRALTFAITDGAVPSNEGRGYVIRRIARRSVRYGLQLGQSDPFLYKIVPVVVDHYSKWYPELVNGQNLTQKLIQQEEEAFLRTLKSSQHYLDEVVQEAKKQNIKEVPAEEVFRLYDTYGLPLDIIEDVLEENSLQLNKEKLNQIIEQYKEQSRASWKGGEAVLTDTIFARVIMSSENSVSANAELLIKTEFTGYERVQDHSTIIATVKDNQRAELHEGDEGAIIVERTPFYAESGGQEADHGVITTETGSFRVDDVQKVIGGNVYVHYGKVESGTITQGQEAHLKIDVERRHAIQRAHTSTHLLHAALRQVLGDHVRQSGSKVGPDYLRFDFSHFEAMTAEQITEVEHLVNEQIMANKELHIFETSLDEAKAMGATALFGEKYGQRVRVVEVPDWSMELCGGTHVKRTGDIGLFHILSESASSQGIRRIEAVTGMRAWEHLQTLEKLVKDVANHLDTTKDMIITKIDRLTEDMKEKDKQIKHLMEQVYTAEGKEMFNKAEEIDGIKFINAVFPPRDPGALITAIDAMRSFNKPFVAALGTLQNDKPILVLAASQDIAPKVNLREVINIAASYIGGKGGGRPTLVQAGGSDASRLSVAIQQAVYESKRRLGLA